MLKEVKWSNILISIIYIVIGILLIAFPKVSGDVITSIIGIGFLALGAVVVINYFLIPVKDAFYRNDFVYGVIAIVFGLIIITKQNLIADLIPVILGIVITASGVRKVQQAIVAKRINYSQSAFYFVMGIISIILGVVIMFWLSGQTAKNIVFIVIGAGLVYDGVSDLIATLFLANKFSNFMKTFKNEEEDNVIDVTAEDRKDE
ncbi:MAG: DUF308 domain-containing protein [Erysipelotrichaceae bacterium]|nr:DUF308 domain-containing protein [Erysipelotrichaceae bacterium]